MENPKIELATANSPGTDTEYQEPPYQIESSAYRHAVMELDILCKMYPLKDNPPTVLAFIPEILALVNRFGHSGQSGGSAPLVAAEIARTVRSLCLFETIAPITGMDEEWTDVREYGGDGDKMVYQNKRLSSIFKDVDGRCWYSRAVIFKSPSGSTWHSNSVKLPDGLITGSKQYIKSFPFTPKTIIVDVIETEVSKDNWDFSIDDIHKLREVNEYYDLYLQTKPTGE